MDVPIFPGGGLPEEHPCNGCAACCKYVAIPIDTPEDIDDYDGIIWYLLHENIRVYVDHDDDWYVEFSTKCKKLRPDLLCGAYEERPILCEEYHSDDCMRSDPKDNGEKLAFEDHEQFLAYMKKKRIAYDPRKIAASRK